MNLDKNLLPKFTAEASVLNSNTGDDIIYNQTDYSKILINRLSLNVIPTSTAWCSGCTGCDPETGTKECSHWDNYMHDCLTTVIRCGPRPHRTCSCSNASYRTKPECHFHGETWCCDNGDGTTTCTTP